MTREWAKVRIGDVAEVYDGPHATPNKTKYGPIFLGINTLENGRLNLSDVEYLSEEDFVKWTRRVTPSANDVVFSYETRIGQAAIVPPGLRCCLGRRMGLVRTNPARLNPRFFLYQYLSPSYQEFLLSRTIHGSTVDRIPLKDFPDFLLALPSIDEQHAIAHILGMLDDKIELNLRMNETLEAIVHAIFKSWFVDFDPVRAKASGESADSICQRLGLSPDLLALFPARFEDSELGEIPVGWEAKTWGDLVILEYGKSLREYDGSAGMYPVYGTNGRIGYHSKPLCTHPGIIIGRKGAYRGVHFCSEPFFVIDTAFYVEPRQPVDLRWAYYELLRRDINSMDSGSAIPSTSREDFYSLPVCSSPFPVQQAFSQLLNPLWVRQEQAQHESAVLATLRDTLLPKLISGEIQAPELQR
jgi:type I restriction enzyme S subunit